MILDELIEMPRIRRAIDLLRNFQRLRHCVRRSIALTWPYGVSCSAFRSHPSDQRCRRYRCLRVRPQPRLKTLHKASEVDDSAVESHASRRRVVERNHRRTRDDDTKTRLANCTVAHQASSVLVTSQGVECSVGCRSLRSAQSKRDSALTSQAEIRRIRPLTALVETVSGTHHRLFHP